MSLPSTEDPGPDCEPRATFARVPHKPHRSAGNESPFETPEWPLATAMIFAARYAHSRQTGAANAVVMALMLCWPQLSPQTREQVVRESHEATHNRDDWDRLRDFATHFPDGTSAIGKTQQAITKLQ